MVKSTGIWKGKPQLHGTWNVWQLCHNRVNLRKKKVSSLKRSTILTNLQKTDQERHMIQISKNHYELGNITRNLSKSNHQQVYANRTT